jgi:hypothetical protein
VGQLLPKAITASQTSFGIIPKLMLRHNAFHDNWMFSAESKLPKKSGFLNGVDVGGIRSHL